MLFVYVLTWKVNFHGEQNSEPNKGTQHREVPAEFNLEPPFEYKLSSFTFLEIFFPLACICLQIMQRVLDIHVDFTKN